MEHSSPHQRAHRPVSPKPAGRAGPQSLPHPWQERDRGAYTLAVSGIEKQAQAGAPARRQSALRGWMMPPLMLVATFAALGLVREASAQAFGWALALLLGAALLWVLTSIFWPGTAERGCPECGGCWGFFGAWPRSPWWIWARAGAPSSGHSSTPCPTCRSSP